MKLMSIVERTILWNQQRYGQVFDPDLAFSLLLEETEELFQATDPVERLDAIGDIIFVAIGALWKVGIEPSSIESIFNAEHMETMDMQQAYTWTQYIALGLCESYPQLGSQPGAAQVVDLSLYCAFVVALGTLRAMGMQDKFYSLVHIICDSNHTKTIVKTDPTTKANIDKGAEFVPPTEALTKLYKEHFQ